MSDEYNLSGTEGRILKQRDKHGQKPGGTRAHSAFWEWRGGAPYDQSLSRL